MVPDRRDGDPGEPSLVELVFPHDVADGLPHIVESLLEILGGQIIGGQAGLGELGLHVGIGEGFLDEILHGQDTVFRDALGGNQAMRRGKSILGADLFGEGGHVWEFSEAFGAGYADHGEIAGKDIRLLVGGHAKAAGDMASEEGCGDFMAAGVADMGEIDAGRGVADPKDPDGPKDCVWLDMTGIDPERMKEVLPQVVETIEQYANLDPAKDLVPIKPTAHYTMGGIPITTDGEVYRWADGAVQVVDGLFAAGECSCVSVHGANRLGGNSLLDACLFGTRAGQTMAARIVENPVDSPMADDSADDMLTDAADQAADSRKAELDELLAGPIDDSDDGVPTANPYQLMAQLGSVMEQALAVRCTAQTIDTALTQINNDITPVADTLRAHDKTAAFNQEVTAIWEVRHLIELAEVMLHASESRQESRGSMQRLDFPERDDEHFLAHSMVADDGSVSFKPVHITDYPPKKREY